MLDVVGLHAICSALLTTLTLSCSIVSGHKKLAVVHPQRSGFLDAKAARWGGKTQYTAVSMTKPHNTPNVNSLFLDPITMLLPFQNEIDCLHVRSTPVSWSSVTCSWLSWCVTEGHAPVGSLKVTLLTKMEAVAILITNLLFWYWCTSETNKRCSLRLSQNKSYQNLLFYSFLLLMTEACR